MCTPNHTQREAPGMVRKYVGSVCGSLGAGEVDGPSSVVHTGLLECHREAREPQSPATAERVPVCIKHMISMSKLAFWS